MGAIGKIFACVAGTTAAWALAIKPRTDEKPDMSLFSTYDYANGGCHDFGHNKPEHCIQAYEDALRHGYGVVIEVRLTKDGIPVAFPDHELWRMCGVNGTIENSKWDKLRKLSLLGTDQKIPTLDKVLQVVNGQVPVIIQINQWKDNYGVLSLRCAEILDKYEGIYAIQALDYRIIRWFMQNRPAVIRGQMMEKKTKPAASVMDTIVKFMQERLLLNLFTKPDYVSCHLVDKRDASLMFCRFLYHVPVAHWIVRTEDEYEASREDGAIVIFEDIEP